MSDILTERGGVRHTDRKGGWGGVSDILTACAYTDREEGVSDISLKSAKGADVPVYKRESMQLYHNVVRMFSLPSSSSSFPQDHCFCVKGLFVCLSPSAKIYICQK